jgi:hypothetical protein
MLIYKFLVYPQEYLLFQFQYSVYFMCKSRGSQTYILVRAECMRQLNEVAIKLGIISPPPPPLSCHLLNLQ